jgi:hypothetical protein
MGQGRGRSRSGEQLADFMWKSLAAHLFISGS